MQMCKVKGRLVSTGIERRGNQSVHPDMPEDQIISVTRVRE